MHEHGSSPDTIERRCAGLSKTKTYYYLKISDDNFFMNPVVKKIYRKFGSSGVLIYLQLLLRAAKNTSPACSLVYHGIEDDFKEEFALLVPMETGQDVELTGKLLDFLIEKGLLISEAEEPDIYYFPTLPEMVGQRTDSAERMARKRQRDSMNLQSDGKASQVTPYICDGEASQVTQYREEIEKSIDRDRDRDIDRDIDRGIDREKKQFVSLPEHKIGLSPEALEVYQQYGERVGWDSS